MNNVCANTSVLLRCYTTPLSSQSLRTVLLCGARLSTVTSSFLCVSTLHAVSESYAAGLWMLYKVHSNQMHCLYCDSACQSVSLHVKVEDVIVLLLQLKVPLCQTSQQKFFCLQMFVCGMISLVLCLILASWIDLRELLIDGSFLCLFSIFSGVGAYVLGVSAIL